MLFIKQTTKYRNYNMKSLFLLFVLTSTLNDSEASDQALDYDNNQNHQRNLTTPMTKDTIQRKKRACFIFSFEYQK